MASEAAYFATWSGSPSNTDLSTIAGITRHGYTFQSALASMGFNDVVGRVQDAVIGRFISADPYATDPQNPADWNPYSYVYNNPLTNVDPSGFAAGELEGECTGNDCTLIGGTSISLPGNVTLCFGRKCGCAKLRHNGRFAGEGLRRRRR